MAVRCENCQKFASLEPGEPELDGEIDVTAPEVSATVRLPRTCADCGDELQEYTFELQSTVDDLVTPCEPTEDEKEDGEHDWELPALIEFESTERMDDKDGKIKHARYMKKLLGVESTFVATCVKCKTEVTITLKDETAASSFENTN